MMNKAYLTKAYLTVMAALIGVITFAQDDGGGGTKKVDVNVSTNSHTSTWGSPWIWIVGAAVFILLLVALSRGSGKRAD